MKIRKPKKLWTDLGKEFVNTHFKSFLSENNIELYHTFNEGKAMFIEIFNRTLKDELNDLKGRKSQNVEEIHRIINNEIY